MADPRVTCIPADDVGEKLIDVSTHGIALSPLNDSATSPGWRLLRAGVVDRLVRANGLLPDGIQLLHVEGYRTPQLQAEYFSEYCDELSRLKPELDSAALHQLASRYVSPPDIAPHCAGAAVDLTLAGADGRELDMGTPIDASPENSNGACYTHATNISPHARQNRTILVTALTAAGLVNYPTEWWHWSFGDRYWAMHTAQPAAIYATTQPEAPSRDRV